MDRLIWFLHFHKAGGSSVVELARRNDETFAVPNANGNPVDARGKQQRPWELTSGGLRQHVSELRAQGVTFVASEWGVPDLVVLAESAGVSLITVIRHPVDRVISNFVFDHRAGFTAARTVLEYVDHHTQSNTASNYYCRQLLGREWRLDNEPSDMVGAALARLRLVDHVVLLEDQASLAQLAEAVGWTWTPVHEKHQELGLARRCRLVARFARRGRGDLIRRALVPAPIVSSEERRKLETLNRTDLALWDSLRLPSGRPRTSVQIP